jgi:aspartyl/asparaginyl beta-hydroxylase (cupin superfamily)
MDKRFYTVSETFPFLQKINTKLSFNKILDDLNSIESYHWKDWPEYDLWKHHNLNQKWTILPLKSFGKWSSTNIKLCPNIYEIFKDITQIVNIGFSRLSPGTMLKSHQGWANLSNKVLRCHLGLVVPGPAWIYCENEKQKQEVGKWVIFDDSKIHSADNQAKKDRIVLIVDIERPSNVKMGQSTINDTKELLKFIEEFNS